MIQNFLELVRDVPGTRSHTSFERYEQLGSIKKDWKKLKTAMKVVDFQYSSYLEQLPADPQDLDPEYWEACFSQEVPVPCSPLDISLENFVVPRKQIFFAIVCIYIQLYVFFQISFAAHHVRTARREFADGCWGNPSSLARKGAKHSQQ